MEKMVLKLKSDSEIALIKKYLHLFKSYFNLTDLELNVLAQVINMARAENGDLKKTLNYSGRSEMADELNITKNLFDVTLFRIKRKGVYSKKNKEYILNPIFAAFKFDKEGCILQLNLVLDAK